MTPTSLLDRRIRTIRRLPALLALIVFALPWLARPEPSVIACAELVP